MVSPDIRRFEVWLVQFDPTQGAEIHKTRPCVILSPDEMAPLRTALVAPMTSQGFAYPTRVPCTFQGKSGFVVLDQLRAVDKLRLVRRLGVLAEEEQRQVAACLLEMFAW